jgi:hypothetical protein
MIIVPRKFIYAGSVRTGSHFIYDTLMERFPGAIRTIEHHTLIPEVLEAKRAHQLPLYTVVRDPLYVMHSLWRTFHAKYPHLDSEKYGTEKGFREFVEIRQPYEGGKAPYDPTEQFPPGYQVMYRHVADMFFPFEPNFETFFSFIGLNDVIETEPKEVDVALHTDADRELVYKYFAADLAIYRDKLFRPDKAA